MVRPGWIAALRVTLPVQTVASFVTQSLPAIASMMAAETSLRPKMIGKPASVIAPGTVLFPLADAGVPARSGPVRTLPLGNIFALLIAATSRWSASFAAVTVASIPPLRPAVILPAPIRD
ncbi:hypothetical protein KPL78_21545 [Roseomonas sp. HJA6]|uniref:Uncharacterized protein n=1 Tax=Roseomonas alba TaxID=2846776 RepID=A0ABS7AH20_9PROT|nr:hypothetical protein [Neoroseomonas alba]MBW6400459.1 hypothetical protein [Neoroseomonas alba]